MHSPPFLHPKTANEAALVLRSTSRGDESFSRSCTDGENCLTVNGIAPVTLKFGGSGDDAAMFAALSEAGAFEGTTSHKIFEESKSLLA